ncbi:hypothetical protein CC77DRAFT_741699 [Alternaria alternata]|uniref:Uncharacterized protein n=1 Tax=Alternaria alternata TaxID=5599 RepID=A0A177DUF4_ALTAL|nr:hypothetical protein CC77DRAFT_741699 [Alternaria alternata]OAG22602.1 hypothetical protein CC77DRAFT_741699 [Alternaria alternata]
MLREVGLPSEAIAMCGAKSIEFQEFVRRVESLQRSSLAPSITFASDDKVVVERLRPMANLQLSNRGQSLLRSIMDLLFGFTAARQQPTNAHRCLDYAWRTRLSTFYFAAMSTRTLQERHIVRMFVGMRASARSTLRHLQRTCVRNNRNVSSII